MTKSASPTDYALDASIGSYPALPFGLVVNPRSALGRGRRTAARVSRALDSAGVSAVTLTGASAAECAAKVAAAAQAGLRGLILVGGDGILGLVLQIPEARRLPIGIVPAGSGNDFAKQFDLPRDARAAIARILSAEAQPRRVDLGIVRLPRESTKYDGAQPVREHWFAGALSVGLDAAVNRRANAFRLPLGPLRYHLALLAEIAALPRRRFRVEADRVSDAAATGADTDAAGVTSPDGNSGASGEASVREYDGLVATVMNISAIGGGVPLAPRAIPDDGMLDLVEITYGRRARLYSVLGVLAMGKHEKLPEVRISRVRKVVIDAQPVHKCSASSGSSMAAEIGYSDGDPVGAGPFEVTVAPGVLRLLA